MKTDDHSNKRVDIFIEDMINLEKQLDAFRLANTIVNILLVGRAPKIILVTGVLGILFLVYYSFVATPLTLLHFQVRSGTLFPLLPCYYP